MPSDARLQTSKDLNPSGNGCLEGDEVAKEWNHLFRHHHGNPHDRRNTEFNSVETRLADTDHGQRLAVQVDRVANDSRIRAESVLPEVMAKHGDGMSARIAIILGHDRAAQCRIHTEQLKVVARHQFRRRALGLALIAETGRKAKATEQSLERLVSVPELPIDGIGHRLTANVGSGEEPGRRKQNQSIGLPDGEPSEQHLIEHRKDGRIGANPDGQRQHNDQGKTRILAQRPDAVPEILPETPHDNPLGI